MSAKPPGVGTSVRADTRNRRESKRKGFAELSEGTPKVPGGKHKQSAENPLPGRKRLKRTEPHYSIFPSSSSSSEIAIASSDTATVPSLSVSEPGFHIFCVEDFDLLSDALSSVGSLKVSSAAVFAEEDGRDKPALERLKCKTRKEWPAEFDVYWSWQPPSDLRLKKLASRARFRSWVDGIDVLSRKDKMTSFEDTLETHVARGPSQLRAWCMLRFCWGSKRKGLWIVKDALSNGGRNIWILTKQNWRLTLNKVSKNVDCLAPLVIQRYVSQPHLWDGKHKYHLRIYVVLSGNFKKLWIYSRSLVCIANRRYKELDNGLDSDGDYFFDPHVHITNISTNVHDATLFHNYVSVDLKEEEDKCDGHPWRSSKESGKVPVGTWSAIKQKVKQAIEKSIPTLSCTGKGSSTNFQMMGIDFLPEDLKFGEDNSTRRSLLFPEPTARLHLLEINAPPCLSTQCTRAESQKAWGLIVNPMLKSLIKKVMIEIEHPLPEEKKIDWSVRPVK
mmetsp:Transcript_16626/g.40949  ORF Transcript_16626/g.40949 Transcript_16626/m.40949 type:complete len:503 (+) Transcript_16626:200-1708(+)